ncbi:TRAP transporter substrate-binding protein [Alkalihalobacillus sp. MEB130]|uniref:TRAP transporter substrate-binding protein n=1 Tax=Alkalihalobacillus sp. MEB130 TaxID=2976704 RepID=UPI0028DE1C2D|nr:TRAP transporter substrate-binding protein [Alkalihalobacillus sp. MEB130]MDT8860352.1 TRAP transporter substrate-binding protein [Alkalihalobacillus sp. MEB130]
MKLKKKWLVLVLVLLLSLLAACNSSSNEPTNSDSSEPSDSGSTSEAATNEEGYVIRLGSHLAPDHSAVKAGEKFKELVEEKSDGRIEVRVHPAGELGDQNELIQSLQVGTIEMTINDTGLLANFAPKVAVLDLPYMFSDIDHVHRVYESSVGEQLKEDLLDSGIRSLGWYDSAFRHALLNTEVSSFEDFKGLTIRTPEAPTVIDTVNSWGATATPIPWGDLYTSLETGVVDGFEGSAESIYSSGVHDVVKYIVETEHIFTALSLNISDKFYQSLSDEDKQIIDEAGKEATLYGRQLANDLDEEFYNKLLEEGLESISIDRTPFEEAAQEINKSYAERIDAVDLVEEIASLR